MPTFESLNAAISTGGSSFPSGNGLPASSGETPLLSGFGPFHLRGCEATMRYAAALEKPEKRTNFCPPSSWTTGAPGWVPVSGNARVLSPIRTPRTSSSAFSRSSPFAGRDFAESAFGLASASTAAYLSNIW